MRLMVGIGLIVSAACQERKPGGQVLAVVNGEEITIPELNAEARARGLVIGSNFAVRNALLQELIDRRLLAQEAHKQGLDKTPDYILASRRAAETALVQELVTDASRSAQALTPQQLNALIAGNPQAFDQRAIVTVEQVGLAGAVPAAKAAAIAAAPSLEAAAAILGDKSLAAAKAMQSWDTARLDPSTASALTMAPTGRVMLMHPPGGGWILARKISATPAPIPPDQRAAVAGQLAKAQISQGVMASLLERARSDARVETVPERKTSGS